MADVDPHQAVTHLFVTDALEANSMKREAATCHLLEAAATIIVDAHRIVGLDATDMVEHFADYLVAKVMANVGDVE